MRVIDTLSGLAQLAGRARRPVEPESGPLSPVGALGQIETRLAGVVVAALKEAFDRDRARMDLERTHMESERQRAEEALRAELRRQSAERLLGTTASRGDHGDRDLDAVGGACRFAAGHA